MQQGKLHTRGFFLNIARTNAWLQKGYLRMQNEFLVTTVIEMSDLLKAIKVL